MSYGNELTPLQEQNLEELWLVAASVQRAGVLDAEVGHHLPPLAAQVTRAGLAYFAQPLTRADGTFDGRLAWAKRSLGFGRQLKPEQRITEPYKTPRGREQSLLLALQLWLSRPESRIEGLQPSHCIHQFRDYGIRDPRKLAALFVFYIGLRERGYEHRPALPDSYR
ncbi:MAG: hypothetical protein JWN49_4 [Parcubacteria group bacterium]|nr:hypothetical protein [Parcubacteria group bacterium]